MTFIIKHRVLPGAPYIAEYDCASCGRFERSCKRDEHGEPPQTAVCECGIDAAIAISAAHGTFWTSQIVPINPPGSTRHDQPDPRALDTRDLAEGKVTKKQWRAKQLEITKARRHAKRIKTGRAQRRVQIDSVGVK